MPRRAAFIPKKGTFYAKIARKGEKAVVKAKNSPENCDKFADLTQFQGYGGTPVPKSELDFNHERTKCLVGKKLYFE